MSELGSTQATASHNPAKSASENPRVMRGNFVDPELKAAACRLMKCLGIVRTHRNLYIVQLAIESECEMSSRSIEEAAIQIIQIAGHAREMGEHVDYFWFEDSCWRYPKLSFKERDEYRDRVALKLLSDQKYEPTVYSCWRCQDAKQVFNYGPGKRLIPCPDCAKEVHQ